MCIGLARQPPDAAYLASGAFPQGRCVDGQALVPADGVLAALIAPSAAEGAAAMCVPRCVQDTDCRPGSYCERRGLRDAPIHDDGGCMLSLCIPPLTPTNCSADPNEIAGGNGTCVGATSTTPGLCFVPR
jgi:hypothetical protein